MAVGIRAPEKGKALLIPTDVADAELVEVAAELVENQFEPIDIGINNAMWPLKRFSMPRRISVMNCGWDFPRASPLSKIGSFQGMWIVICRKGEGPYEEEAKRKRT